MIKRGTNSSVRYNVNSNTRTPNGSTGCALIQSERASTRDFIKG